MQVSFHGAAQTVTGSKHLITLENGIKILLDCGLFQGMGKETRSLNENFGFNPKEISLVILSHAHIDHSGLLPKLFADGYQGKIYCTPATAKLAEVLLYDSAHIQESDVAFVNKKKAKRGESPITALYTKEHVDEVVRSFETFEYEAVHNILPEVSLTFTDAGHIIGSAAVHLNILENKELKKLTFSGDVGRFNDAILDSPKPFRQADVVIVESTYGDSLHSEFNGTKDALLAHITETCVQDEGHLIIPAFSVGRTQELLYALNELDLEGKLPNIPVYVDSPLSTTVTAITKLFPNTYNKNAKALTAIDSDIFDFKGLHFITKKEESMALNGNPAPCVIISASGMAEAGRVKHHIANNLSNSKNKILFVGYVSPEGLGGRLLAGDAQVKVFTEWFTVVAKVASIRSMSAHGDYEDLLHFLSCQNKELISKLFLVHGEHKVQNNFKDILIKNGFSGIEVPAMHQNFDLS